MPMRVFNGANVTQRCQVPSGWTGPSHLAMTFHPPYRQPALAGAAEAISAPAVNAAASPPTINWFVPPSCASPLPRRLSLAWAVFAAFHTVIGWRWASRAGPTWRRAGSSARRSRLSSRGEQACYGSMCVGGVAKTGSPGGGLPGLIGWQLVSAGL